MKKLSIGIQSFEEIRKKENNYIYVDKTKIIYELLDKGSKYNFMSRPRRFGKSLLVDTIKCLYQGKKELFKGLYIFEKWDFKEINPVIKIDFGEGKNSNIEGLEEKINYTLDITIDKNKLDVNKKLGIGIKFGECIRKLSKKTGKNVVILVDEYDKPILDNITNLELAKQARIVLRELYSTIKSNDEYLKFVLLTGVSKFSKVSLFSGLNNLEDITLSKNVGELCGFSENEIIPNFKELLDGVDRKKMREWYNGFNFLGEHKVYNPFNLLLFLKNKEYKNYWFETATPTFLIELLKKYTGFYNIPDLENISAGDLLLGSFDIEKINIETLLFQTGYLTIKESKDTDFGKIYKLETPNKEIKISLNSYILSDYLEAFPIARRGDYGLTLYEVLNNSDIEGFINLLKQLFSGISYSNIQQIAKYEGYYVSVIYTLLYTFGFDIIQEDITNHGRIDLTIKLGNKIYIIEFKVEKTGKQALKQIKDKKYSDKYLKEKKQIFLLGINFNFEKRNIDNYEYEEIVL